MIEYSINVSPVKRMKNVIRCVLTLMKYALHTYVARTLAFAKHLFSEKCLWHTNIISSR